MIQVFNSLDIFDVLYECAEKNNCAYIYFKNDALDKCKDDELINSVYSYYEEFLPDDMMLIIRAKRDNIIKCLTQDIALINAMAWFPNKEQLGDLPEEYYFKCFAIDNQGIIYQN